MDQVSSLRRALLALLALLACLLPVLVAAQTASFRGRVLTDSTEHPIPGVVVSIPELKLQATSDSLGNFIIANVSPGAHIVSARKIGFGPITTRVTFARSEVIEADLLLTPTSAQSLPEVNVETKTAPHGKLIEFDERRNAGNGGRFLTQADLEKHSFATFTDALRVLPGLELRRDPAKNEWYAVAGRMATAACALCGGGGAGPPPSCLAAVVVDGAFVFQGYQGETPFNLNSINPTTIAGVEYYANAASMPVKYNGTRGSCGLLMIWTK